jgi:hypothetical protein
MEMQLRYANNRFNIGKMGEDVARICGREANGSRQSTKADHLPRKILDRVPNCLSNGL